MCALVAPGHSHFRRDKYTQDCADAVHPPSSSTKVINLCIWGVQGRLELPWQIAKSCRCLQDEQGWQGWILQCPQPGAGPEQGVRSSGSAPAPGLLLSLWGTWSCAGTSSCPVNAPAGEIPASPGKHQLKVPLLFMALPELCA